MQSLKELSNIKKHAKLKQIKLSLVGVGHVFGDDDVIADRPFKATLTCIKNDSFLYTMAKADFVKFFKQS